MSQRSARADEGAYEDTGAGPRAERPSAPPTAITLMPVWRISHPYGLFPSVDRPAFLRGARYQGTVAA
ncbi:hypothetical protein GCM10009864_07380 [Streptomyces lunalinharesii]|uniref:Uncharacterized protein n=1 Tax=Streptomyces lunalinharesii TaxID=333384 RepID=A0ABN3R9F8_9ACTN